MKCGAVFNVVVVCDASGLSRKCLSHVCDHSHVIKLVLPESQILLVQNRWELLSLWIVIRKLWPFIITLCLCSWLACSSWINSEVTRKYSGCCSWWETGVLSCIYSALIGTFASDKLQQVCLPIRIYQGDSHWTDFMKFFVWDYTKICRRSPVLFKIRQKWHALYMNIYVHLWSLAIIGVCKSVFFVRYALILKGPFSIFFLMT